MYFLHYNNVTQYSDLIWLFLMNSKCLNLGNIVSRHKGILGTTSPISSVHTIEEVKTPATSCSIKNTLQTLYNEVMITLVAAVLTLTVVGL